MGRRRHAATCLIIPGLNDSGPGHWQTAWVRRRDDCRRVELGCWESPLRGVWLSRLDQAVRESAPPVVLVAHSLGCIAVAWWASLLREDAARRVSAALLVAPADVERPDASELLLRFAPAPAERLPFPSIVVASRDDRYASFDTLERLAAAWGSRLVDVGARGHINADSGLGDWPEGQAMLNDLIAGQCHLRVARTPSPPRAKGDRIDPPAI